MPQPNASGRYILGLDIGGTKLAVVIADRSGTVLHKIRRSTDAQRGARAVVDTLCDMAREAVALQATTLADLVGIGVSCGGPLDTTTGVVYSPPNLPGWDGIPLRDWLEADLGVATFIDNDANASALAEWLYGAGRGYRNVVYMTMSTGIGGGLILDGRLYRGIGDAAGEVGHMTLLPGGPLCGCGKHGCLEAICSGPAIARRAREALAAGAPSLMTDLVKGDVSAITAETVMTAARKGDETALRLVDETARYMAIGLGNIVNVLNPEIIIIGTIIVKAGDLLLEPIRSYLRQETWERVYNMVQVVPAGLGDAVGDLAAVAIIGELVKS